MPGAGSVILQRRVADLESTTYDLDYFENRKPFKKVMERVCDFSYYTRMEGSPSSFWGHYTIHYYFSYDMDRFLNSLPELKRLLRKTKIYRHVEETQKMVESIPDDWRGFSSYNELSNLLWELIDLSKPNGAANQHYHYDIANDVRQTFGFQKYFYGKMTRPMISVVESNGWEREAWRWWLDVPTQPEEIEALTSLQARFEKLGFIDQKLAKTRYVVDFVGKEYSAIDFDSNACTYLSAHNRTSGKLNIKQINMLINMNDDDLFQAVYKGGIMSIFEKESEDGLADG